MQIPLATNDWIPIVNDPRLKLHNMYVADNPTSPDGLVRLSRPTLSLAVELPDPIYGAWTESGVITGSWFVVSGTMLYRVDNLVATEIGSIPGTGYAEFAGTALHAVIVRDNLAYITDGSTVSSVPMPDDVLVSSVTAIDGFFLLSVYNSNRFYWITPGELAPDALAFASAERYPDNLIAARVLSDEIWFLGKDGPEVWTVTGALDLPFERIPARVYNEGCISALTAVNTNYRGNPALIWVTDRSSVVLAQGNTKRVSNESVEDLISTATNLRAWSMQYNSYDMYVLTSDEFTLVYNLDKDSWARWDTYGEVNWRAHIGFQQDSLVYAGDYASGKIWLLTEGYMDETLPVIREVTAGVPNTGNPIKCSSVVLRVNAGWVPVYNQELFIELRYSDDQGANWSEYLQASLGLKGKYSTDVIYRSLGVIYRPGRLFEIRISEPARIRIDYMTMNEA